MNSIYVHIPFCQSRCRYCDFFSTTLLDLRHTYVDALIQEYALRQTSEPIHTIYLGGGTPSLLDIADLQRLMQALPVAEATEVTLEANPGDVTKEKILAWQAAGVNRLSIGIQSLHDDLLTLMGRRHSADEAHAAVQIAQEAGIKNISVDLMYGLPTQTIEMLQQDAHEVLDWNVQHLSAYCLSYEDNTPLTLAKERGELTPVDEDTENTMYDALDAIAAEYGMIHYEISNYALSGYRSQHNSTYWNHSSYLGLGAGAHSFDGKRTRRWNNPDLNGYIAGAKTGHIPYGEETLTDEELHIEHIMLSLRTREGVEKSFVDERKAQPYLQQGLLRQENNHLVATLQGQHILNRIIEDLL